MLYINNALNIKTLSSTGTAYQIVSSEGIKKEKYAEIIISFNDNVSHISVLSLCNCVDQDTVLKRG